LQNHESNIKAMTATNHALVGALIGAALPLPLAIPAAYLSHFALDAVPHYGVSEKMRDRSSIYKAVILSDALVGLSVNIPMIIFHQWNMLLCGWLAYSPDAPMVYYYFKYHSLNTHHRGFFAKYHIKLPHDEFPGGLVMETAAAAMLYITLIKVLVA